MRYNVAIDCRSLRLAYTGVRVLFFSGEEDWNNHSAGRREERGGRGGAGGVRREVFCFGWWIPVRGMFLWWLEGCVLMIGSGCCDEYSYVQYGANWDGGGGEGEG